jgi:hypothetical protein
MEHKMKLKHALSIATATLFAGAGAAWGAGNWSTLPIAGSGSFCGSTVSGVTLPSSQGPYGIVPGSTQGTGSGICGQTIPAGPAEASGTYLIPADTGLTGGAPPQTVTIPNALVGSLNTHTNRIIGGDFGTNLWQRGTTPLSAASPATYQMSADRFFAISQNNVMTITKQTPANTAADYIGNLGLNSWMRVARPSGTPSGSSCVGQILDQEASQNLIGNNAVLSFWGYAPTTFSAANYDITATIAYYTATDSATGGTNTATFALSGSGQAGGITGYTAAAAGLANGTPGSISSGVATIPLSATPTRYGLYAPIPAANSSGTAVNGVGIVICATPTAATTVSTDYFEIEGVQLQAMPSAASVNLANGVTGYTGFEFRPPAEEAILQYAYSYVFNDGGTAGHGIFGTGWDISTAAADVTIPFPAPMREAPAATVSTATSFAVFELNGTTTQACTTLAVVANSLLTNSSAAATCTTGGTALTADAGTQLTSDHTGATNLVTFSAEP